MSIAVTVFMYSVIYLNIIQSMSHLSIYMIMNVTIYLFIYLNRTLVDVNVFINVFICILYNQHPI